MFDCIECTSRDMSYLHNVVAHTTVGGCPSNSLQYRVYTLEASEATPQKIIFMIG